MSQHVDIIVHGLPCGECHLCGYRADDRGGKQEIHPAVKVLAVDGEQPQRYEADNNNDIFADDFEPGHALSADKAVGKTACKNQNGER